MLYKKDNERFVLLSYLYNFAFKMDVIKLIKDARKANGMSQKELAEAIDVDKISMNRIENGKMRITVDLLNKIAKACDSELLIAFAQKIDGRNI